MNENESKPQTEADIILGFLRERGRQGGQSKSPKKMAAILKNLAKGRAKAQLLWKKRREEKAAAKEAARLAAIDAQAPKFLKQTGQKLDRWGRFKKLK